MKTILLGCIALTVFAVGPGANAEVASCPNGRTSPFDLDQFYAKRAITVVQAALRNDPATLDALVAPQARFEVWRGDYTTSARRHGVPGLLEMVRDVGPTGFLISTVRPGPVAVSGAKCAWSASVLFRTERRSAGVAVKLDFVDGILVRAMGNEVALTEGHFR